MVTFRNFESNIFILLRKLGDDSFGHSYMDALKAENICTKYVGMTSQATTGIYV